MNNAELRKLAEGELIKFTDLVTTEVTTRFGEATVVCFADEKGTIFRKCYAQGGMLEFLAKNPDTRSLVLKKKLSDGEYTYNVWARE